ncbi:aliphatic sulfonate ABC transporter substrate-binding protein [Chitinasiproducens palmae]|uniref:Putative aliphatic sulfonates-binding protein n=1 Tax=Chitinasiproducens palmae TaxID=1770053 RepID=A0A1H2PQ10_9BURK|nr:aliphatic sulfonate ABC transporter substrate-binding protein [Chitinasiproducens palmae]SDV48905.1 sulfonate transport system substrate-binding protein [Chitinasiproducens palmae]
MKGLFRSLLALVAFVLLFGARVSHAADTLRVGFMPFVPYSASLIAKQNGWIEEELRRAGQADVSVKWVQFAGGPPVNEAMASHNIDIAALGDTPALVGHASGIDDRMIGLSYKGGQAQALVVRSDSPVHDVRELKGKKVATLRGGNVHELLVLILASAGLKLTDVQFVNLGLEDMGAALLKGDIDAALVWDPVFVRLDTTGKVRVLKTGEGLKSNLNPIIASAEILKQHPQYVQAYLRAIERGAAFLRQQPQAAAKQLAPVFGLTPEQTQVAFTRSVWVPPVDAAVRAELKRSVTFLLDNRLIRNPLDIDSFIDLPKGQ